MAKLTRDEFISSLKEMSLLEIKELVDAMKEEFGVDPSAVAVAAPVAGGSDASADAAPSAVTVTLVNAGAAKVNVIKVIKENVSTDEANELKAKFEEAGATIELK